MEFPDPDRGMAVAKFARFRTSSTSHERFALNDQELVVPTSDGLEVYDWDSCLKQCPADGTDRKPDDWVKIKVDDGEGLVSASFSADHDASELVAISEAGTIYRWTRIPVL